MDDTISRKAAIDATWEEPSYTDPLNVLAEVRDRIKALPSAQPEIVRCLECKHCRKVDEFEYWCYGFCSPARLVRKDDFCSYGCKYE